MQKINYQKELERVLAEQKNMGRKQLLLHSCCGPCSSAVLKYITQFFDVTLFYYNPNIFPKEEYEKRLETQKNVIERISFSSPVSLLEGKYDPGRFSERISGLENEPEGGARCAVCFELRLEETAKQAELLGVHYFSTTLTVSPHKNAQVINEIGMQAAKNQGSRWLPGDFKKRGGYAESIALSKQAGLYRQNYCGCPFSKKDE